MRGRKTPKMLAVEAKFGFPIEELISELMPKLGTQAAVAARLGISKATLFYWLNVLGFTYELQLKKVE